MDHCECTCGSEDGEIYFFADEMKQDDAEQHEGKDKHAAGHHQE